MDEQMSYGMLKQWGDGQQNKAPMAFTKAYRKRSPVNGRAESRKDHAIAGAYDPFEAASHAVGEEAPEAVGEAPGSSILSARSVDRLVFNPGAVVGGGVVVLFIDVSSFSVPIWSWTGETNYGAVSLCNGFMVPEQDVQARTRTRKASWHIHGPAAVAASGCRKVDEILTFHRDVNISHERSKCASKLRKQSALGP
ncbi:hypothetical protein AK812_SmicGene25745 [Symbiodinium microadriaticum]|uniref:Uncharacterized protein n=1 Tax=Symbiodinium microadriaticum TaxID=2951 RepID=A0A1Q9DB68_SYMMI|nr:hypothetical protein AK812_SmicGene25745 [Symbiodinium microadriaticum]